DHRYTKASTSSRAGLAIDPHIYEANTNIKNFITSFDVLPASLLNDEAQFLSEAQVIQLTELADDYGITVMCYGLKNDAFNHLFEGSQNLLIYADNIKELKTECWYCHKKATMILRFDESGKPVYTGSRLILAAMKSTYLFVVNVIKKLMLLNLLQRTDMKKANTPHKYIGFLTFTFYFRREFYIFFKK